MTFEMTHRFFKGAKPTIFTEDSAPKWLKEGGVPGSTMDNRWFWNDHVITLKVGETVLTDFQSIRRIA